MSQELMKLTEATVMPLLNPKRNDLIELIGETRLKKESSFALQAVNANDYLSTATPQSVAKAIWNIAITGLTLNPIHKLAYLTPRRIKGVVEAVLIPSYQGLVKLLTDTGSVQQVYAYCVYKGDVFKTVFGTSVEIVHEPKFDTSREVTHVYAVGILKDGTKQVEVMNVTEINEIRDLSDGYKAYVAKKAQSAIWVDWYDEMSRKTVIKRLSKYLPKTERWEQVQNAIDLDNSEYAAADWQYNKIETLLSTSAFDDEYKSEVHKQLQSGISKGEAESIIWTLNGNQLNKIQAGLPYSTGEISKEIDAKE